MPHHRKRHLSALLNKSLKFWPVVCLVGSRQVGKSTFLKTLTKYHYRSFDDPALAMLAERNPKELLEPPCVFDEAQKVPKIFDAVKLDVDTEKRPGKYVITGSVRFSRRTLIRESLTGRAKTIQMFPLTCAETRSLDFQNRWALPTKDPRIQRKDFQRYLAHGGMPAIFSARNPSEVSTYWKTLTESYVYRDLLLVVSKNPRPVLAFSILKAIAEILALGELPLFARILKKVGGSRPMVERHLYGLEDMMILHRIPCLDASPTKDIFMPFDPAFFLTLLQLDTPHHDSAIHTTCMHITFINEALAHAQDADQLLDLRYAISAQGEMVHLITQDRENRPIFWKITDEPVPHEYQTRFLKALIEKHGGSARILSSTERIVKNYGLPILPWETVL